MVPAVRVRPARRGSNLAPLHHEPHVGQYRHIVERVARYGDQVREQTRGDAPPVVRVDQLGRVDRRRPQHLQRFHAPLDERDHLLGAPPVRDRLRVRAHRDADAGLCGPGDDGAGVREHLGGLGAQFGRGPGHIHAVDQRGRRDEEGAAFCHQLDGLVVQQEAVLDAVDARLHRSPHRVGPVRVRGHLEAAPVGLVDDGTQLRVGVALRAGGARMGHDTPGSADLDEPRPVLDLVPHGPAHLVDPVGDALLHGERHDAGGQRAEHARVQMTAGRRDRVPRGDDPGPSIQPASTALARATSSR